MSLFMTPAVTIAFPSLFTAKLRKDAKPKDKPMFSAAFLFDAAAWDAAETKAIRAAVEAAAIAKWGAPAFKVMVDEGTFENPFKRDISAKKFPASFVRYFSASSGEEYPPGVFMREIDPATKRPKVMTDKREVYAGAVVRASVTVRCYGGPGTSWKPGAKLDLRNVQKLADGERLVGGASDGSEFDALPPLPASDPNAGAEGGPLGGLLD